MSSSPKFKDIMNISNTVDIYNTRKVLGGGVSYPDYVDNFLVYEDEDRPCIQLITETEFEKLSAQEDNVLYFVIDN